MRRSPYISAILLAGGIGKRMDLPTPKQFLLVGGKPVIMHSLELFLSLPELSEIIVVMEEQYRSLLPFPSLRFALPGSRRQDSLYSGLQHTDPDSEWILVHDAARPFPERKAVLELIAEGQKEGAATLAVAVKSTIREGSNTFATHTLDREKLFEIQTPQFLRKDLLLQGFEKAHHQKITVTDDVSLAELVGHPIKLVKGNFSNIKITTQEDLTLAEALFKRIEKKQ